MVNWEAKGDSTRRKSLWHPWPGRQCTSGRTLQERHFLPFGRLWACGEPDGRTFTQRSWNGSLPTSQPLHNPMPQMEKT